MKPMYKAILVGCILLAIGCSETGTNVKKNQPAQDLKLQSAADAKLYTAYNIWKVRRLFLRRCINYKFGNDIIPAGTEVIKAKISKDRDGTKVIKFVTAKHNKEYNIYFVGKWHPGKIIEDYLGFMFTTKPFDQLTTGMTETEIEAIRTGRILSGMSKKAVLICYGYPPEHRTRDLDENIWVYWENKLTSFNVCFDENERTTLCR